jgi:DNA-binding winged helix-turn-helix (wHTH) protein/Tol biopolymer transport system component
MRVSFGPFAFDRQSQLLWRDGTEVALPPRVLGVLEHLIERAGQVVARQELLDGVWKDAFVTDTSLAEAVSFLRQALGDDPQSPRYIQTVHRRGYRFLAPVVPELPEGQTRVRPPSGDSAESAVDEDATVSAIWQFLPLAIAGLTAIALMAAAVWGTDRQDADTPPVARFEIRAAPGTSFDRRAPALAVSPDGRVIAWSGCESDAGTCSIFVRPIDRLTPQKLAGTEGAMSPFFSPDSRWIGFFADGTLKKVAASGGPAAVLADVTAPAGGAWGTDGRIAFAAARAAGISVVSDEGGRVTTLTTPRADRGEVRHVYPSWLPSGGLMFTAAKTPLPRASGDLVALSAGGRDWQTLRTGVVRGALVAPAYLLLSSGTDLQAVTFDERSLTLTGGSDSILATVGAVPIGDFSLGGGTLVATSAVATADDPNGDAVSRLDDIAVSPDGRRAAGVIAEGAGADIWMVDLQSGALTRMTYGSVNVAPAWSADGSRLFFATRTDGPFTIASRSLDDRGTTPIGTSHTAHLFPSSVAADGRVAATTTADGHTAVAIVEPSGSVRILAVGPFDEAAPAFSPEARWLALESAESGRTEVVAREMATSRRVTVSTDGGLHPRWSSDGRAVFYDTDRGPMRAAFDPQQGTVSAREPAPGNRLGPPAVVTSSAYVILQWLRDLRQRLPLPTNPPR